MIHARIATVQGYVMVEYTFPATGERHLSTYFDMPTALEDITYCGARILEG